MMRLIPEFFASFKYSQERCFDIKGLEVYNLEYQVPTIVRTLLLVNSTNSFLLSLNVLNCRPQQIGTLSSHIEPGTCNNQKTKTLTHFQASFYTNK